MMNRRGYKELRFGLLFLLFFCSCVHAQPGLAPVEIKSKRLRGPLYLLEGAGGRQIASIGPDGVLLVDASYEATFEQVRAEVHRLGGDSVRYVINTHWHPDHTDGNRAFGGNAVVIAHEAVRRRLLSPDHLPEWAKKAALPPYALPELTFDSSAVLYINSSEIQLRRRALCHTDSDISVYFKTERVLHLGDAFLAVNAFPPLNPREGCGVTALQETLKDLAGSLPPDVIIVTGHGGIAGMSDLVALSQLVDETVGLVRRRIAEGWDLQQIQADGLPDKYAEWGSGFAPVEEWLALVYSSLRFRGASDTQ